MTPTSQATSRKVQVANGDSPSDDRFIVLTSHRLLATPVWVVGVVDGTGRLTDPPSLLVTPDHERARRHANRLFNDLGGEEVEPTHYASHIARDVRAPRAYGIHPAQRPATSTVVTPPRYREKRGKWHVCWQVEGERKRKGKWFPTEQQAHDFYNRLTKEMSDR
ncbi:hypothetical protein [Nocardioides sp. TF02-7]|uniref:hypothetical protein n=1 Tax=Nocardioides sp. TF02-7 TaxID=2917724 RepID=UPI001F0520F1|nr:hypothetical protein [Nocardioides sp. TF02-7]UMG92835.1 hypothetical protein MF408_00095 [Nocardioides sp. TF02-7]